MLKHINKALLIFLMFLLVINTVSAQQHSKVNSVQDCLDLYEGSFSCFRILAEKTNNISLCDYPVKESISVEEKNQCIRNVAAKNKNIDACDTLTGKEKDRCISGVIWELQDESLCSLLSEESARSGCQWNIIEFKDYECSDLWDNVKRDFCYMGSCQTLECCDNIKGLPESSARKNNCISKIGVQSGDFDLCIQTKKRKCILDIIDNMEAPSPEVCEQFKGITLSDEYDPRTVSAYLDCIGTVAKVNENPELCIDTFDIEKDVTNCLSRVKHIEACKLMTDIPERNKCANYVASFVSHNPDDCNVITDASKRISCRGTLNVLSHLSNPIIDVLIMLIIAGLYFVVLRHKEKYLPLTVALAVVFVQRIFLLILPLINILMEAQPITQLLGLVINIRFTDWFIWFARLRGYIAYNWLYLLIADILTLAVLVLIGYIAQRKGISVIKTIVISAIILWILATLMIIGLGAMLGT
ncbi:hypothetical protein GF358_03565 [Candidatus Woesearchaeota archaeon]|nr:hypothetical protein [Candidatus Woesearchaeota archaeon]